MKNVKLVTTVVTGATLLGLSGVGIQAVHADKADPDKTVVKDGSENHYQQQPHGSTIEYGGQKYSVVSKYVAQDHEVVSWEMRMLVGTKQAQVGLFTDQLQPGQYFYTGATPNHYILSDDEWDKVSSGDQADSYNDLTVRIGTRHLDDQHQNGDDLKTGVLHYIAPEYLDSLKLDDKMAAAGQLADKDNKTPLDITKDSDDSHLLNSGYKQGDEDKTTVNADQIRQLMAIVKTQASTGDNQSKDPDWNPAGDTDKGGLKNEDGTPVTDYDKLGESLGVTDGPNGFYTYDAKTRQLKFVVYDLEQVKADADIIAGVIKSLGGADKTEATDPKTIAKAAADAGVPEDVTHAIGDADAIAVSDDNTLMALHFRNLYMSDIRIMIPMVVEQGNVIPNQFDFSGVTWDGSKLGDVPPFEVSDKPHIIVPGVKEAPKDPDRPYKNVLVGDTLTSLNGYNWYGKVADDTINADDQDVVKSAEASFKVGAPLAFNHKGTYVVKDDALFKPGVYIIRTVDGKDIKAESDGVILKNGELLSVVSGSELKILDGSGKFQLVDATTAFAKAASAQSIAKVDDKSKSKVIDAKDVKGKDAGIDNLISQATTGNVQWTWVVSQPVTDKLQSVKGVDVKLIDDLAQDKLVSLKIVDSQDPTKVIKDVTKDALKTLSATDKQVADALKNGDAPESIKDADGLQLSKNLLTYKLSDYTAKTYGATVSFAITVSGSGSTAHSDTASVQLFKNGKPVSDTPQSTNTVKVIPSEPQEVEPTNPVQPVVPQTPDKPDTPQTPEVPYTPAPEPGSPESKPAIPGTSIPSRVNTPVSEKLGDIANNTKTPAAVRPMAETGAKLASNVWFLVLFPVAVIGSVAELVFKKQTGEWLTIKSLRSRFAK